MEIGKILVSLVAVFALVALASNVSAFAMVESVSVNGIDYDADSIPSTGVFAGETIPVRVTFVGTEDQSDVRIVARLIGGIGYEVSERFDIIDGQTYTRVINFELPYDLNNDLDEAYSIDVSLESDNAGEGDSVLIPLRVQRESYDLEILSVETVGDGRVEAGKTLGLDVVVKNRGRHEAIDTFVRVSVPELGITKTAYFDDLSAQDESDPDEYDTQAGRVYLPIPREAAPGVYNVQVEAYTDDALVLTNKRIVIVGAGEGSQIYASSQSRTFGVGEKGTYSMTLVNTGDTIQVFQLVPEVQSDGVSVSFEDSIVAVPAGSARTIKFDVVAEDRGTYNFGVAVQTTSGQLVKRETFTANVEGSSVSIGSATVVLTIVLAIIFVVLLVVLIVLLTRKPENKTETGESYY